MLSKSPTLRLMLRFWQLWVVWILVLLLPVSREVFWLYFEDTPLAQGSYYHWSFWTNSGSEFNPFRLAKATPKDLDIRVWRFASMLANDTKESIDHPDPYGDVPIYPSSPEYKPAELLGEANTLRRDFPHEKWLVALPVRAIALNMYWLADVKAKFSINDTVAFPRGYNPAPMPMTTGVMDVQAYLSEKRAQQLTREVRRGAKVEPQNAYYPLIEAEIWRLARQHTSMWDALKRASLCQYFDNHNFEITRHVFAGHQKVRRLLLEEKQTLWRSYYYADGEALEKWPAILAQQGRVAQKAGDHRRAIEIGVLLARIGDLLQRQECVAMRDSTNGEWKNVAWSLASQLGKKRLPMLGVVYRLEGQSKDFASYAEAHGRGDVAALVPQWAAQQRKVQALQGAEDQPDWQVEGWRRAGEAVLMQALYVTAFWLVVNIFLWWGRGVPSTSGQRLWPAGLVLVMVLAVTLIWWVIAIWGKASSNGSTPTQISQQLATETMPFVSFFAPPFLLGLLCAYVTIWSARRQLVGPDRIETQLRLLPVENTLLRSGAAIFCAASFLATFGLWLVWLMLAWLEVGTIDLLGWLPDGSIMGAWSLPILPEYLCFPLVYCLFLNGIGAVLWFIKWRFLPGKNRVMFHSSLRWWKEAMGVYVVLLSIVYLAIGFCSWPARAAANRELDNRLKVASRFPQQTPLVPR